MKDIGELYKEKFENFTPSPNQAMWEKIAKDKTLASFNRKKKIFNPTNYSITALVVVGVVAMLFLLLPVEKKIVETPRAESQQMQNIEHVAIDSILHVEEEAIANSVQHVQQKTSPSHATRSLKEKDSTQLPLSTVVKLDEKKLSPTPPAPAIDLRDQHADLQKNNLQSFPPSMADVDNTLDMPTPSPYPVTLSGDPESAPLLYSRDTAVCRNAKVVLFVKNSPYVHWHIGIDSPTLEIYPDDDDIYYVDIINSKGKDTTLSIRVNVFDCSLFIPNAFTPNGDGKNDYFKVESPIEISNFNISIFETSGRLVFHTQNIMQGWDGNYEGKKAPEGAYLYIITYKDHIGEKHYEKGQLILYR